ncbi:heterokaryon incompatibility protein-domain-containing protein [Pyrenochaeta sp. MPI-SDFR-AT-0127]|nr:heterokaryon incompatibility protein-domain-containing protein [Pyrenochaeta sp. MPI-SDFR-AT-0127]
MSFRPTTSAIEIRFVDKRSRSLAIVSKFQAIIYTDVSEGPCTAFSLGVRRNINNPREQTFAEVASTWILECNSQHEDCWKGESSLPLRVIDVWPIHNCVSEVRLCLSKGAIGRYACLSYCWGNSLPLRTTEQTLEDMLKGFRYNSLPKTLQDAVTVTRRLGLQYLWVDALCIIQDSKDDWDIQSSLMATIYQNAYVVISADISMDYSESTIYWRDYNGETRCSGNFLRESFRPLSKRAWTFQEEVLATRIIHFGDNELFWACKKGVSCECMDTVFPNEEASTGRAMFKHCTESDNLTGRTTAWFDLVNEYTSREITNQSDRLAALSGVVDYISEFGENGRYLAGLWSTHLPHALLWKGQGAYTRRAIPSQAPTWSWACLEPSLEHENPKITHLEAPYDEVYYSHSIAKASFIEVHDAQCTPDGRNPFGPASNGRLKLTGPLVEVHLHRQLDPHHGYLLFMYPKKHYFGHLYWSALFDFDQKELNDKPIFWLFFGATGLLDWFGNAPPGLEKMPSRFFGLILMQSSEQDLTNGPKVYERVGRFGIDAYRTQPNLYTCYQLLKVVDGSEHQTIVLV